MRINNDAPLAAHNCKVNPVYLAHNDLFIEVLGDIEDPELIKKCYISNRWVNDPSLAEKLGISNSLPENVVDIFRFLLHFDKVTHIILIGDVGWGKTMLFRYIQKSILGESKEFAFTPVLCDFREHEDLFWKSYKENKGFSEYRAIDAVLRKVIRDIVQDYHSSHKAAFFKYLVGHTLFSDNLDRILLGVSATTKKELENVPGEDLIKNQAIVDEVIEFQRSFDYSLMCLAFYCTSEGKIPFFILDNADQFPWDVHLALCTFANGLHKKLAPLSSKTILVVRSQTWKYLDSKLDHHLFWKITLDKPHLKDILSRRIEIIVSREDTAGTTISVSERQDDSLDTSRETKVPYIAAKNLILSMSETLDSEGYSILSNLSNYNVRAALQYIRTYFCSGHIDVYRMKSVLGGNEIAAEIDPVPLHIFLQAVITNNRSTYFDKESNCTHIINLFDCKAPTLLSNNLLRIYTLALFKNWGTPLKPNVPLDWLRETFAPIEDIGDVLSTQLEVLLENHLLGTARFYQVPPIDMKMVQYGKISITMVGELYLTKLLISLPYVGYMKDDTETRWPLNPSVPSWKSSALSSKVDGAVGFIYYLYRTEVSILNELSHDSKMIMRYKQFLVPTHGEPLYSFQMMDSIKQLTNKKYMQIFNRYEGAAVIRRCNDVHTEISNGREEWRKRIWQL